MELGQSHMLELRENKHPHGLIPWWLRHLRICLHCGKPRFNPGVWKISWRRAWKPTPVFLPGESHGQRSLMGYRPWGLWSMGL